MGVGGREGEGVEVMLNEVLKICKKWYLQVKANVKQ